MAKSKEINMKLPALDDLFSTQEQRDEASHESVRNIPLSEISDFPDHPFKVKMDESMSDLVDSIREYGVLVKALYFFDRFKILTSLGSCDNISPVCCNNNKEMSY